MLNNAKKALVHQLQIFNFSNILICKPKNRFSVIQKTCIKAFHASYLLLMSIQYLRSYARFSLAVYKNQSKKFLISHVYTLIE